MKQSKELVSVVSEESLALLRANFPTDLGFTRVSIPRISMASQDKTEGKGKAMKVVVEAGTFFTESQTDEENDEGKKIWEKKELGDTIKGIIIYQRKQLRYFDESTESYTSSPIFDSVDEVIPLFSNKVEIARGTTAELKSRPEYQYEKDGKTKSSLEDNKVLYILYEECLYQMTLRSSSMYSYLSYAKTLNPSTVVTKFSSESKEKGQVAWNQMTFNKVADLNEKEAQEVIAKQREIIDAVQQEKQYFISLDNSSNKESINLDNF